MADKKVYERGDDIARVYGSSHWVNKFESLEEKTKEVNKDILSTRNCIDFIMKDINICNEKISSLFLANQRRLNLVSELNLKLACLCDERDSLGSEMLSLLPKETFFKEDNHVKFDIPCDNKL